MSDVIVTRLEKKEGLPEEKESKTQSHWTGLFSSTVLLYSLKVACMVLRVA